MFFGKQDLWTEYDFIVVGGGSAGAVIAARLSEIADWTVLLLEAGEDETAWSDVPGAAKYLQLTKMDWKYQTEPQPGQCLGLKGNRYSTSTIRQSIRIIIMIIISLWSLLSNRPSQNYCCHVQPKGATGLEGRCWVDRRC